MGGQNARNPAQTGIRKVRNEKKEQLPPSSDFPHSHSSTIFQSASMHLISTSKLLSLVSPSSLSFSNPATSLNSPSGRPASLVKLFSRFLPIRLLCSQFSAASSALSTTPGGIPHILAQCMP